MELISQKKINSFGETSWFLLKTHQYVVIPGRVKLEQTHAWTRLAGICFFCIFFFSLFPRSKILSQWQQFVSFHLIWRSHEKLYPKQTGMINLNKNATNIKKNRNSNKRINPIRCICYKFWYWCQRSAGPTKKNRRNRRECMWEFG